MTQNATKNADFSARIDHTLLKPTATTAEIDVLCQEAIDHRFKTVCVPPVWVGYCASKLFGSGVGTITVVGFPLGYSTPTVKAAEAREAIKMGASEIDMVINLSALKSGDWAMVELDIRLVAEACAQGAQAANVPAIPLKVIIETAYLTNEEKVRAAQVAESAGATFVKTSTGFATPGDGKPIGATVADIKLLRASLKPETKIKASGGIRDLKMAQELIDAGADRLGTSSGVAILKGIATTGY
ncbi:MAG: deoxyribose-phosphate aldolase [Bdellovibrionales bacterium]|nr:deoxyribose-phosphate aldolase [Bdellovibrionales bacterium]